MIRKESIIRKKKKKKEIRKGLIRGDTFSRTFKERKEMKPSTGTTPVPALELFRFALEVDSSNA
jgi:hypothetical protein